MITGSIGMSRKSGGTGGGKMFNIIKIPASGKYDLASGKWLEEDIPTSVSPIGQSAILGDFEYRKDTRAGNIILKRNLSTNVSTLLTFQLPSSIETQDMFTYNNEVYLFGGTVTSKYFILLKINENTLTSTEIYRGTVNLDSPGFYKCYQVTETRFLFLSPYGIFSYDFASGQFAELYKHNIAPHTGYAIQRLQNGDYLIGLGSSSAASSIVKVCKYFTLSNTITTNIGQLDFPNNVEFMQTYQLGNKLLYVTGNRLQAGHNTGEIDLEAKTVDFTKFPDHSGESLINRLAGAPIYQNNLIYYSGAKKYYLPLIQSPPEQNAVVAKIYKGQYYNTPFDTVEMSAIPNQPEFTVSPQTNKAAQDLTIHLGQYEHIGELPINVWEE